MGTLGMIGFCLLAVGVLYCGWRLLVLGHEFGARMRRKPEGPISIFGDTKKSK
jgi:hypothetical protein